MSIRYKNQWDALAAEDPYWAVLSSPSNKHGKWDKDVFFRTGTDEINALLQKVVSLGMAPQYELALDYGCGVGRLSRALSLSFKGVLSVDISEAMLLEAQSANKAFGNIRYHQNNGESLENIGDESVDFIYSNIVLQHCPAKIQRLLIKEFCRVLRPGGTLIFQTPSHKNIRTLKGIAHLVLGNRILNLVRRIKNGKAGVMEMHTLRKTEVLRLLGEGGMSLCEAERYDAAGIGFVSYRYFARKAKNFN